MCRRLRRWPLTRLVPVLILTGDDPPTARVRVWEAGADGFMSKPFRPREVVARCGSLLRHKEMVEQLDPAEWVVVALARALVAKTPYAHGHPERVTEYPLLLGERVGWARETCRRLSRGSPAAGGPGD